MQPAEVTACCLNDPEGDATYRQLPFAAGELLASFPLLERWYSAGFLLDGVGDRACPAEIWSDGAIHTR